MDIYERNSKKLQTRDILPLRFFVDGFPSRTGSVPTIMTAFLNKTRRSRIKSALEPRMKGFNKTKPLPWKSKSALNTIRPLDARKQTFTKSSRRFGRLPGHHPRIPASHAAAVECIDNSIPFSPTRVAVTIYIQLYSVIPGPVSTSH